MKFKFLGIYSIISLMFAGNIFAVTESSERDRRLAELEKQTENVNVKNRRDMWENRLKKSKSLSANKVGGIEAESLDGSETENSERDRRLAELKKQTNNTDVKSRREMWENRIKKSKSISANKVGGIEAESLDGSKMENSKRNQRLAELRKQTENVDVKSRREMWENRSKEARDGLRNRTYKKGNFYNSENKADKGIVPEKDSLTDSRIALVTEEIYTEPKDFTADSQIALVAEEINVKQSVSSDFNKFAENLESKFFELKKIQNKLEQEVEDFSGDLRDSESSAEKQQKAETLKKDLVNWSNKIADQIADFKKIQKDFEGLEIDKKIKQLSDYRAKIGNMSANVSGKISQIQTNRRKEEKAQKNEKKQNEQVLKSIDWQAIKKYNEEDLSKFVQAIQNYKLRFSVIERYGKKCFDDQDARELFDPNLKMNPSLKGLCKQIYEDRFPEAIKVWSEIKKMKKDDPNYAAVADKLREKIRALGKNVSSLIKQSNRGYDSSQNNRD